jgi:hypothetical protein
MRHTGPYKGLLALLLLMFVTAAMPSHAQSNDPAAAQGEDKDKDKDKDTDDLEPGKGKISSFGESLTTYWSVSTAFQGTQSFDDNVFQANNFRKSDTLTKLSGRITAAYRAKHTRFEASYLPEFNLYQRYDALNYSAHNYYQTFQHEFSPRLELHWNLSAQQTPSRGNLPFKLVNFGGVRYNMYSLSALKDGLNLFNGSNLIGISYKWTPRLKMITDLEGIATHFSVRGNPSFNPISKEVSYSAGGKVTFEYLLNSKQTIGVSLSNTYLGAIGPTEHQHFQSARVTFSQKFPRRFSLDVSVGPGFTERQGGSAVDVGTFFDVGVSRQTQRSGFAVSFQRSTQVGLLQDSVSGYGASGRANRNFGRKWITNLGGAYMRSESSTGRQQLESASGNLQIGYRLTQRIIPYINYGYTHQKSLIPSPDIRNVNRNEVSIGFVYNFGVVAGNR